MALYLKEQCTYPNFKIFYSPPPNANLPSSEPAVSHHLFAGGEPCSDVEAAD